MNGRIVEDFVLGFDDFYGGKSTGEEGKFIRLSDPSCDQLAPAALNGADHAVDVVVAHAADGEFDVVLRRFFGGLGNDRIFDDAGRIGAEGHCGLGQSGHHGSGAH